MLDGGLPRWLAEGLPTEEGDYQQPHQVLCPLASFYMSDVFFSRATMRCLQWTVTRSARMNRSKRIQSSNKVLLI